MVALVIGLLLLRYGLQRVDVFAARYAAELAESLAIALALVLLVIRPFVVQAFYIPSASMRPTLVEWDRILVNKFIYRFKEPKYGDVVVFKSPPLASTDGKEKDFVKRLVGLPGDVVEVRAGTLFRNGRKVTEAYLLDGAGYDFGPEKVLPGTVFVMGDNRNNSNDSRTWGLLERKRVLGKAMVVFWPISRIKLVK